MALVSQSVQVDTQTMATGAAVIAVVVPPMGSYYSARLRLGGSLKSAKTQAEGTGKAAMGARRAMLMTGITLAAAIYLWIQRLTVHEFRRYAC